MITALAFTKRRVLLPPVQWVQRVFHAPSRERETVTQAAKMAIAAVAAWVPAGLWWQLPQSFIAPYAAVFVMSATVYRSMTGALQQITAVSLGVLLAFVAMAANTRSVPALAIAVFLGALIGQWPRFDQSGIWVAITALLMITSGAATQVDFLVVRVGESIMGALIGVAVNTLIFPPMRLRSARAAVQALGQEVGDLLSSVADALRDGWDQDDAYGWLQRARSLDNRVHQASTSLSRARESLWLNPRFGWQLQRRRLHSPAAYESAVRALRQTSRQLQHLMESLAAAGNEQRYPHATHGLAEPLAQLLDDLGHVASEYADNPLTARNIEQPNETLLASVRRAHQSHDDLIQNLEKHPTNTADLARIHAGMLIAIERALTSLAGDLAKL